jgi:hypothetical protein
MEITPAAFELLSKINWPEVAFPGNGVAVPKL